MRKKEARKEKAESRHDKEHDIAYDFAIRVCKHLREVIKSIVLFGSTAKGTSKEKSDIDIIIIVDDCTIKWDQELIAWYREELSKILSASSYNKKLHINTVTLSAFWNQILIGDPVVINVLRYGISLIDFGGFFSPLKILLAKGKIRPTKEAIYTALKRAPMHLSRSKFNILASVEAIYWAMVDSSHAALMSAGEVPPSPEHIGSMLEATFVKKGMLKSKFVDWYKEVYALAHVVSHGELLEVSGNDIQMYRKRAEEFLNEMAVLVDKYND